MKTIEEIKETVDRIRIEASRLSMSPDTPMIMDLATAMLDLLSVLESEEDR